MPSRRGPVILVVAALAWGMLALGMCVPVGSAGSGADQDGATVAGQSAIRAHEGVGDCGPSEGALKTAFTQFAAWPYNWLFNDACRAHDECYVLAETGQTQSSCDSRFLTNLRAACDSRGFLAAVSQDGLALVTSTAVLDLISTGRTPCKAIAERMHWAVARYGDGAASNAFHQVAITSVKTTRIDDYTSDDEYVACVRVTNIGNVNTEFDVQLLSGPHLIDTEPDIYDTNLSVGESDSGCVGTDWTGGWSWYEMDDRDITLVVRMDDDGGAAPLTVADGVTVQRPDLSAGSSRTQRFDRHFSEMVRQTDLAIRQKTMNKACGVVAAGGAVRPGAVNMTRRSQGSAVALFSAPANKYVRAGGTMYTTATSGAAQAWEAVDIKVLCSGLAADRLQSKVAVRHRQNGALWRADDVSDGSPVLTNQPGTFGTRHIFSARCQKRLRVRNSRWMGVDCHTAITDGRAGRQARIAFRSIASGAGLVRAGCTEERVCTGNSPTIAAWEWFEIRPLQR